jgi:hypothetical protein
MNIYSNHIQSYYSSNVITQDLVKCLFTYHSISGWLTWNITSNRNALKNSRAGKTDKNGYRIIKILGKPYKEHRIVWLYHYGYLSKDQIDHINRIKDDNRIENLRECSNAENHQNRGISPLNTSGYPGIYWSKISNKWHARIGVNNKRLHLGFFDKLEDAIKAYDVAKKQHHPFSS